jgi:hypothetical protein
VISYQILVHSSAKVSTLALPPQNTVQQPSAPLSVPVDRPGFDHQRVLSKGTYSEFDWVPKNVVKCQGSGDNTERAYRLVLTACSCPEMQ